MKILILIFVMIIEIIPNIYAQVHPVNSTILYGRVISQNEENPLPGVTVTLLNQHQSSLTDSKGGFKILLAGSTDTLIVHAIGYATLKMPVEKHTTLPLNLVLKKAEVLLRPIIVSTGYQDIPKERATGSFEHINNQRLSQRVSPDILSRLEGVSSILFDKKYGRPPLTIRGLSTINGPKSPLIIVNNFPYNGDINNINPNDIKSVTILKDAAAVSIWGTRAGNGVIVITTKQGDFNQSLQIDVTSNITLLSKEDLSYLPIMKTSDFINTEIMLFHKGFYDRQLTSPQRQEISPVVAILNKERNNQVSATDADIQINTLRKIDVRKDFEKYLYQQGVNQQYAFSLHGGSPRISYLFFGGVDRNMGTLDERYDKYNLRVENRFKPFRNFELSLSAFYTKSNTVSGKPGYKDIYLGNGSVAVYPYAQFVGLNGAPLGLYTYNSEFIDTVGRGKLLDWKYYPLQDWKHDYTSNSVEDLIADLSLSYTFLKHFQVRGLFHYESQQGVVDHLADKQSFFTRDLINKYSQVDNTNNTVKYIIPLGGILDKTHKSLKTYDNRIQINYNQTWRKHDIAFLIGSEMNETQSYSDAYRVYGYDRDILTSSNIDYVNTYPTIIPGYNQSIPNKLGFSDKNNRFVSFFGNGSYTYDSRYVISGSIRRDGSNLFGVNTNNKWTPLWSAGVAWNVFNEKFYHLNSLPYIKLRATYGFSGNADPNRSALTTLRFGSSAQYTNYPIAIIPTYPNPELKWEKVRQLNFGLDFRLKNNRISGSTDLYFKKATDLFGPSPLDQTVGIVSMFLTKNVADLKGKGIEVILNTLNLRKGIVWTSNLIFDYSSSHVAKYFSSTSNASYFLNGETNVSGVEGKPVYSIFAYKWAGLDPNTGSPRGYLNGKISEDYSSLVNDSLKNMEYIGPAVPLVYGNFNNTFSFKGFRLTASIIYKLGYSFRRESIEYNSLFYYRKGNSDFEKRWREPGDEKITQVPSLVYPSNSKQDVFYANSSILVENADNIRLQYVDLSYDFSHNLPSKSAIKSLELHFNIDNVGIIWRANRNGIDPDYYDNNIIPPSVNYSLGVNATF